VSGCGLGVSVKRGKSFRLKVCEEECVSERQQTNAHKPGQRTKTGYALQVNVCAGVSACHAIPHTFTAAQHHPRGTLPLTSQPQASRKKRENNHLFIEKIKTRVTFLGFTFTWSHAKVQQALGCQRGGVREGWAARERTCGFVFACVRC
jgi:hypothetical protein